MAYDDWFQQTFGVDTSGNTDLGTGGDAGSYSGATYDSMFSDIFGGTGANQGFNLPADYGAEGGGSAPMQSMPQEEPDDSVLGDAWGSAQKFVTGVWDELKSGAEKLFVTPAGTETTRDAQGRVTTRDVGPALNTLGQTLLAGVLKSVGEGMATKWVAGEKAKAAKKERAFTAAEAEKNRALQRENRDIAYSRVPYGQAPQLGTPTRGVGLIGRTQ